MRNVVWLLGTDASPERSNADIFNAGPIDFHSPHELLALAMHVALEHDGVSAEAGDVVLFRNAGGVGRG